jgi:hypothetical protein
MGARQDDSQEGFLGRFCGRSGMLSALASPRSALETRMDLHKETPLERAQRRLADAQARVAHQATLVAALAEKGVDTALEKDVLASMKDTLDLMREALEFQQKHADQ